MLKAAYSHVLHSIFRCSGCSGCSSLLDSAAFRRFWRVRSGTHPKVASVPSVPVTLRDRELEHLEHVVSCPVFHRAIPECVGKQPFSRHGTPGTLGTPHSSHVGAEDGAW